LNVDFFSDILFPKKAGKSDGKSLKPENFYLHDYPLPVHEILHFFGFNLELGTREVWENSACAYTKPSWEDNIDIIDLLISSGADVDKPINTGCTPLIFSAQCGHTNIIRRLIDAGANLSASVDGATALMFAVSKNNYDIVHDLCVAGADVNQSSSDGTKDALVFACAFGYVDIVPLLLSKGATNIKMALAIARHNNQQEVVPFLLKFIEAALSRVDG
jgi:hypothetical protein